MGLGRVSRKMRMRFTKYSFTQRPGVCLRETETVGFLWPLGQALAGN